MLTTHEVSSPIHIKLGVANYCIWSKFLETHTKCEYNMIITSCYYHWHFSPSPSSHVSPVSAQEGNSGLAFTSIDSGPLIIWFWFETTPEHNIISERKNRKEHDSLGFSKSSSNIVYPISDFVSYHRLCKTHLAFSLQLSYVSASSHFQEALGDPKWKAAMVEEMKALHKNSTWKMFELP